MKTNNQGSPFGATLSEPIVADGKTVAPAGSSIRGTVTEAQKAGYFEGSARPGIRSASLTIEGVSLPAESAVSFQMTNSLTLKPIAATADDSPSPQ